MKNFYQTLPEAINAIRNLNINSQKQYNKMYKLDPMLPASPSVVYASEWKSWMDFLGNVYYETIQEASSAAIALGIDSYYTYISRHHLDPLLPRNPFQVYKKDWHNLGRVKGFLKLKNKITVAQTNVLGKYYETIEEASSAAVNQKFISSGQYIRGYKSDPKLSSSPKQMYPNEFEANGGWEGFLSKKNILDKVA